MALVCSEAVTPKLSGLTLTTSLRRARPTDGLLWGVRPSPPPRPPPPPPGGAVPGALRPPPPTLTGGGVLFKPLPLPADADVGVDVGVGGAADVGAAWPELVTLFSDLFNTLSR